MIYKGFLQCNELNLYQKSLVDSSQYPKGVTSSSTRTPTPLPALRSASGIKGPSGMTTSSWP